MIRSYKKGHRCPGGPSDITKFDECSYEFEEINRWDMEED